MRRFQRFHAFRRARLFTLFVLLASVLLVSPAFAGSPNEDAIARLEFGGGDDESAVAHGEVALGVALTGEAAAESRARGGDGKVARFERGGWLSVSDAINARLAGLSGRTLTFGMRVKASRESWASAPLMSKNGGHDHMVFNMFLYNDALGAEVGATELKRVMQTLAPRVETRNPEAWDAWRDVYCRVDGAKAELFVDGRCCDEDFMLGDLRTNDVPFVIGAQYDAPDAQRPRAGFVGEIDYVAIWDRALSNDEIVALSGGADKIDARERTERTYPESMQYWTPPNAYGVGDCMPFYAEGVFHFMYLLDKNRHGAKNGLGAHQWIQATSTDLKTWKHQPFVVPITDQNEGSICTGSVFYYEGTYYAFYANRSVEYVLPNGEAKKVFGLVCLATSKDGIHFEKEEPQPLFLLPEGYGSSTRDPFVYKAPEDGRFYMLITTNYRGRGCWARAVSDDLRRWEVIDPIYSFKGGEPECPDLFRWGDDYYLIANHLNGYYMTSKSSLGPWEVPARPNILMNGLVNVPKTAPFGDDRRIICGWTRERGFGGSAVFHELTKRADGTLGEKFVDEMRPETLAPVFDEADVDADKIGEIATPKRFRLRARLEFDYAKVNGLRDVTIDYAEGRSIRVVFAESAIYLNDVRIERVDMTRGVLDLDCYATDTIVDLCVNGDQTATFASRDPEERRISLRNESPENVAIKRLTIAPLK